MYVEYMITHALYRLLGECLLISSLPGKTLRMLVDIARLAERFNMRFQSQAFVNLKSKDANLVFYLSVYPIVSLFQVAIMAFFFVLIQHH